MIVQRKRINPYNEKQTDKEGKVYFWSVPDERGISTCELPDKFAKTLIADSPEDYCEYVPQIKTSESKSIGDYSDEEIEAELNRRGRCSRKKRGA